MSQIQPEQPPGPLGPPDSPDSPDSPDNSSAQFDAELQKEIDEALGDQSIEQLMSNAQTSDVPPAPPAPPAPPTPEEAASDQPDSPGRPGAGKRQEFHMQMKRGRIAAIRGEDVFVELAGQAGKHQGIVPLAQFERAPRLGSVMDFVLDHVDEQQGLVFLSREGAVSRATWDQLKRGAIVEARVVAANKGGLELEMVGGIRAFMPASQVDIKHIDELEALVGQKLEGLVQEIDRRGGNIVMNRRQLLQQRRLEARAKLLDELEVGQVLQGKVSSVVAFGAFVDLGGVDGLIHVSDMSYTRVENPADVIKVGQAVNVKVLKISPQKDRIGLGLKQIEPDPWEGIEQKYKAGEQVSVRVVRTANFGAFVELEAGVEGLLPISEISWQRIGHAEQVIHVGDVVRAAVLNVDAAKHRISVSLKQAQDDPWMGAQHKYAKNSLVAGKVISLTDFGAFVELQPGVEGLVHISQLSDKHVERVDQVLQVGQNLQFRVLEINEDTRKVKLSLKAVDAPAPASPTPSEQRNDQTRPPKAKPRKVQNKLKGGMEAHGIGLGGLSLDDLK